MVLHQKNSEIMQVKDLMKSILDQAEGIERFCIFELGMTSIKLRLLSKKEFWNKFFTRQEKSLLVVRGRVGVQIET